MLLLNKLTSTAIKGRLDGLLISRRILLSNVLTSSSLSDLIANILTKKKNMSGEKVAKWR
ncbi:hypothetical protein KSS87_021975 [Heliosperma pusillum]|nr:hypothetical protein KSS87_021975 [Heliosperma pusillum]